MNGSRGSGKWWLALAMGGGIALAAAQNVLDLSTFPRGEVEIQSAHDRHTFRVWIADTPARQQQGLMFVRDLDASKGMLFIDPEPRRWSIWMKNTYVPLDILFIGPDGRIAYIVERARPHSLEAMGPKGDMRGVLEIKGGEVANRRLRVGDRITWRQNPESGPSGNLSP